MSDVDQFYFFQNDWSFFTKFDEIFRILLDESGQPLINDLSEISRINREFKTRQIKPYIKHLQMLEELRAYLTPDYFLKIPQKILAYLLDLKHRIDQFHAHTRSIRTAYKNPNFMQKIEQGLIQLKQITLQEIEFYENTFSEQLSILNETEIQIQNIPDFMQKSYLWFTFETLKQNIFKLNRNTPGWLKLSQDFHDFQSIIQIYLDGSNKSSFSFKEISSNHLWEKHQMFNLSPFRIEWFHLMSDLKIILPLQNVKEYPKSEQKLILTNIRAQMNHFLLQLTHSLTLTFLNLNSSEILKPNSQFTKNFNPYLLDLLKKHQSTLIELNQGDMKVVNQQLQEYGDSLYQILEKLEDWLLIVKPLLSPVERISNKYKQSITHVRGNIDQELEEFEQYVKNLEQSKYKIELEKEIASKIKSLEKNLTDYQEKLSPLIKSHFPEIDMIKTIIHDHKAQIQEYNQAVQEKFEQFKDKKNNIYSLIQLWESKYQEILNRMDYSIKTSLQHIFHQYDEILRQEEVFFDSISSHSEEDTLPTFYSGDFVAKDAYGEEELRNRIKFLENKIQRYSSLTVKYSKERDFFISTLEDFLRKSGLESKKCIICHKEVNVAEDHFIKCEFCGSLSHYACVVWWLTKYNSCPVCHNKYSIPNNALFDPDKVEQ